MRFIIIRLVSIKGGFSLNSSRQFTLTGDIPEFIGSDIIINDGNTSIGNIGEKCGYVNLGYINTNTIALSVTTANIDSIFLRATATMELI